MSGLLTVYHYQDKPHFDCQMFMDMLHLMEKRGNDGEGYYISADCMMGERMSKTLEDNAKLPFSYTYDQYTYKIVYTGELYNALEIKNKLIQDGYTFQTNSDYEVVIVSYIAYQENCLDLFDGHFAFVIEGKDKLFIARDQLGIQPLYYHIDHGTIVIASEIKCILKYIGKASVNQESLFELLGLGPSLTPGHTLYTDIFSLKPGHYMYFDENCEQICYWKLHDEKHDESFEESVKKVKELVIENIQKQTRGKKVVAMLSGGLDSSIITAIASQYVQPLSTYSITYNDQAKYFKASDYQTTQDDDYIKEMVQKYHTKHHQIVIEQEALIDALREALIARDMPGMADIDSSFLLFTKEIAKESQIALSGECADEIFGGYPWFYKAELYQQPYFPWMRDIDAKIDLFNNQIKKLNIKGYIIKRYQESLSEISTTSQKKQLIYLNTQWFMQTLLTRASCLSMCSHLTVRVPFASTQIMQYLYNMPSDYMFHNNEEKGILRLAFEEFLPDDIAHRKKNPFPKTHSPVYSNLIYQKLKESLNDSSNILYKLFDHDKLIHFIETKGDSFQLPWFGQLMTGPQLMAYFYQIYLWGQIYQIEVQF